METERCPFNGVDCEYIPLAKKAEEQTKEIERLREQERKMTNHAIDRMAEIERLREALRYYANKKEDDWKNGDDGVVARAALKVVQT